MSADLATFTSQQRQAILARGNVLVIAGAGTGKTRTLVECCVQELLNGTASLDRILMVTFTEAAAAEMRQRIRERLERAFEDDPVHPGVTEQLALLDGSMIRTLHSFCYELIREHFFELGLDPQATVLTERQAYLLQEETFDTLFEEIYRSDESQDIRSLIRIVGRGRSSALRELARAVHVHTQTRPEPALWFEREEARLANPHREQWSVWLREAIGDLCSSWEQFINARARLAAPLTELCGQLARLKECGSEKELGAALQAIAAVEHADWERQKGKLFSPLKPFFKQIAFLRTLVAAGTQDPLLEDWEWQQAPMRALLRLTTLFAAQYEAAKRKAGALDFHDLEQYALRLLWRAGEPTELAAGLQQRFHRIFIDEYQDINPAQDRILRALGRPEGNRFMVGDIKQSIYRFRQAAPKIFQEYASGWKGRSSGGISLLLSENFRSREAILDFINELFGVIMTPSFGGIDYGGEHQLLLGNRATRESFAREQDAQPRVELMLGLERSNPDEDEQEEDRSSVEREARAVALRLREMREARTQVWDEERQVMRPAEWSDMVVLLRAATDKAPSYAKEFDKAAVPLLTAGLGLYQSLEVKDLVNGLMLLDNPFQDGPLLAVLRSPLAGLSVEDLANIRLALRDAPFWTALNRWHELHRNDQNTTTEKAGLFLERYHRWRRLGQFASLTQRLEQIIDETHYLDWLATQNRASQRLANVQELLGVARQFDALHSGSLYQFILFVESEQDARSNPEPPSAETENAVRLLTIHKSKGLEFPIVVIPDLGKPFNSNDLNGEIILDDVYGLCSRVHPPDAGQSYPGLGFWLAKTKQAAEMRHEELRVLYVAMTRAKEWLILSGRAPENKARSWQDHAEDFHKPRRMEQARTCLDWLGPWFSQTSGVSNWLDQPEGRASTWSWRIVRALPEEPTFSTPGITPEAISEKDFDDLQHRLGWNYSYPQAVSQSAKASVTALRREAAEELELNNWASREHRGGVENSGNAAEIGAAHHTFLELLDLTKTATETALRGELDRLVRTSRLAPEQAAMIDLPAISRFWLSAIGKEILARQKAVQREIPFTHRLSSQSDLGLEAARRIPAGEFIVIQGTVDLAVISPQEIWIVDFKTDHVDEETALKRAREYEVQLRLYALGLSQIYCRPVTRLWLHFLTTGQSIEIAKTEK